MDQLAGKRGLDLLRDPAFNKGTAFCLAERRALDLEGLLPPQVESLELQAQRCWEAFSGMRGNLERFAFVDGLRRSNLVLFHRFLANHLEAVLPVVYTPTVGAVIQGFSRSYRTPIEGLFLSADQHGRLRQVLRNALRPGGSGACHRFRGDPGHRRSGGGRWRWMWAQTAPACWPIPFTQGCGSGGWRERPTWRLSMSS